jgi:hypothetical protein
LRFGEGLRFAEIAVLLNKREATPRKLCSRTIGNLATDGGSSGILMIREKYRSRVDSKRAIE